MTDNSDIATIHTCIDLLDQHRKVNFLSSLVTVAALVIMAVLLVFNLLSSALMILLSITIVLGLAEIILAIRIGFDQALLTRITNSEDSIEDALSSLDQSLIRLRLINSNKMDRSLDTRLKGCLNLFKKQVVICCAQVTLVAVIIILAT